MTSTGTNDFNLYAALVLSALAVAPVLTWLGSIGLLWQYRRRVEQWMRSPARPLTAAGSSLGASAYTAPNVASATADESPLRVVDQINPSAVSASEPLFVRLWRRPWENAGINAVAGLFAGLVLAIAYVVAAHVPHPLRALVYIWPIFIWPVVLTTGVGAARDRRDKFLLVAAYALVVAPFVAVALIWNEKLTLLDALTLWAIVNLGPTLGAAALLNRRVRAVGPIVFLLVGAAVIGGQTAIYVANENSWIPQTLSELGARLRLGAAGVVTIIALLGVVVFAIAGWLAVRTMGMLYERKRISDLSITLDAIWLLTGLMSSVILSFDGVALALAPLAAVIVFEVGNAVGYAVARRRSADARTSTLLLLRVFSLGARSERLFRALTRFWRHVGVVKLISGPDLLNATIEPHELLDFMRGHLSRRFIDSSSTLERRLAEMDVEPDRDRRFRVNDFFCYEDTWRMVVERLARGADVTVMDLRGFTSAQAGCIYEINVVIATVPLDNVVLIIDESTDERFLRSVVQSAFKAAPLGDGQSPELRLFRIGVLDRHELRRLLLTVAMSTRKSVQIPAKDAGYESATVGSELHDGLTTGRDVTGG